ncbi:MAG: DMT family transporter [Gammaproteobacteria bacterium]|nr:DMT family transporter [Gammaproteobacteria bacterium]MBU0785477.1 DMT family transporter [Gammaproteobacteria bacterium]MBU0813677.1 DMT family transporter [Gammaproteobacteria bacterium]MBU1788851.1 DMT family transporter [Gammaproteobacteria bacterium]
MALSVAAVACFATLDTTTKYITMTVPVLMALWFRYVLQAVLTTAVMLPLYGRDLLRTAHPKYQLLRGVLLLLSSLLAFLSLKYMPVGEFTAIVMITPLAITVLAATTLGEKISLLRWILVTGGFAGTLLIIRPGGEVFGWSMLLPLTLVGTNAWFQILTSRLARTEKSETMHFYTGWVGALLASIALPFVWTMPENWGQWLGLFLMGVMATVGHFLLILAYSRAPAATLTPFFYAQIGFAMLGGWLLFSHVPDQWSTMGIALIAVCGAAGAWLTMRESRIRMSLPPAET